MHQAETNPLKDFIQFQNDRISRISFENSCAPLAVNAFDHDHRKYGTLLSKENKAEAKNEFLLKGKIVSGFDGLKKYKDKAAKMSFEAEKNIEFKTDKEFKIEALENISIKSEKELIAEMQNKISLNSQKEVVINVGSSQIKIENSGKITINCKKAIINSASTKVEIE